MIELMATSEPSKPKITAPRGEPKATETPAAAALARIFRFWAANKLGQYKYKKVGGASTFIVPKSRGYGKQ